jgi:serine/threonine protein kinase
MEAPNALPTGHALREYRIERVLGVGGFGLTYLALDENLQLKVAVKEYLPADIALRAPDRSIAPRSEETAETFDWGKRRFLDESRTLASFRHPNIVRVMRFFEANGTAYMVMEFVDGAPLPDWVSARRPLTEAQVAALVAPLLDGLEVVHKSGFTHRDIKPPNIYIRDDSSPVLLDFGAARQQSAELTALVSPGYAPFEQYHTQGKQGAWSDIYALGGVLYWMVTGNTPHEAAARIRADTMPPAAQAADTSLYRPEFLAAIDWALVPDENQRPQSVPEWREALLGAAPTPPRPQVAQPKTQAQKTQLQPTTTPASFDPKLLQRLEAELAQHLGPIAPAVVRNAARKAATQEELVQMLAADISASIPRAAFQKQFSQISRPVSRPPAPATSGSAAPPTVLVASRFTQEVLDRATARLAEHIGALSRVVVKRAAMKARDEAELYLLIADEIEDPARKKAFIRRAITASGKP